MGLLQLHSHLRVFYGILVSGDKMCKSGLIVKLHQPLQQGSCYTSHTFQKIIGLGPGHILMVLSERIVEQLRDSGHGENRQFVNLESTVLRNFTLSLVKSSS